MNRSPSVLAGRQHEVFRALLLVGLVLASCPTRSVSEQPPNDVASKDAAPKAAPPKANALGDIVITLRRKWQAVNSFFVEHEVKLEAVGEPAHAKRYLATEFLGSAKVQFAFKGNMRYYRQLTPPTIPRLAPDIEPDYSVVPGGEMMRKTQEMMKADAIALMGKERGLAALTTESIEMPGHFEVGYDGKVLRRKNPGTLFAVHRVEENDRCDRWLKQDYLDLIGHPVPDPLIPGDEHSDNRLEDVLVLSHYVLQPQLEVVDGAACLVAVCRGMRLWLDPQLGYAVRKSEGFDPATNCPSERHTFRDFVEILSGIWLPRMIHWERCAPPRAPANLRGKVLLRYTYKIVDLSVNDVPDSLFKLEPKPGWTVWDATVLPPKDGKDQYIEYIMPADPAQVDSAINLAIAQYDYNNSWQSNEKGKRWLRWTGLALIPVLGAVFIFLWYAKRKGRGIQPSAQ